MSDRTSYYGRPMIKEPVWKPEIPLYFFFGGLAGASASLAEAARWSGNDVLARRAKIASSVGAAVSPVLLIKDLGRPARFYNMLRVFKARSPMSVGTWILSAFGSATGAAMAVEIAGVLPRIRRSSETVAGLLGLPMSTYTGALVADSVVPVWHEGRHELPFAFAGGAAAAAGGAAAILTPAYASRPARRLGLLGAALELGASQVMDAHTDNLVAEASKKGAAGNYKRLAQAATIAGAAVTALAGRRRFGAAVGGALLMAGSLCERFAVFHAGKISAGDPRYTSIPQRQRADRSGRLAIS